MNIARPRFDFLRTSSAFVTRCIQRHPHTWSLLARAIAGGRLVVGIAAVFQLMWALPWQTDGLIAAGAASAWVLGTELALGAL
jgi:hypothetical protein